MIVAAEPNYRRQLLHTYLEYVRTVPLSQEELYNTQLAEQVRNKQYVDQETLTRQTRASHNTAHRDMLVEHIMAKIRGAMEWGRPYMIVKLTSDGKPDYQNVVESGMRFDATTEWELLQLEYALTEYRQRHYPLLFL